MMGIFCEVVSTKLEGGFQVVLQLKVDSQDLQEEEDVHRFPRRTLVHLEIISNYPRTYVIL